MSSAPSLTGAPDDAKCCDSSSIVSSLSRSGSPSSSSPLPSSAQPPAAPGKEGDAVLEVISMTGYTRNYGGTFVFCLISFLNIFVFLIDFWFPDFFLPLKFRRCALSSCDRVHVIGRVHGNV